MPDILLLKTALWMCFYLAGCIGFGAVVTTLLMGRRPAIGAVLFYANSLLLGQGLFAAVWLLLALGGWLKPHTVIAGLCLALFAGGKTLLSYTPELLASMKSVCKDFFHAPLPWKAVACAAIFLTLSSGMIVTHGFFGDGSSQNMVVGKVVGATGYLTDDTLPGAYHLRLHMGLVGEMHFAALFALGSYECVRLIEWPMIVAGGFSLLGLCELAGLSLRARWLAWLCLFTSSFIPGLLGSGKVDVLSVATAMGGYFWAFYTFEDKSKGPIRLAGLVSGIALVAKFSFILSLIPGSLVLIFWGHREKFLTPIGTLLPVQSLRKNIKSLLGLSVGFCFWMGVGIAPHVLKSIYLFGDPLITFTSKEMQIMYNMAVLTPKVATRILELYPISISLMPSNHNLSFLVVGFLPLALFLPRFANRRAFFESRLAALMVSSIAGQLGWLTLRPTVLVWRYFFPCLLLMIPLSCAACEAALTSVPAKVSRSLRYLIWVSIVIAIDTTYAGHESIHGVLNYFSKPHADDCEVAGAAHFFCLSQQAINRVAPRGDRVMLLSESPYWLRPDLIQCIARTDEAGITLSNNWLIYKDLSVEDRWRKIYENDIHFVFTEDREPYKSVFESLDIQHPPDWLTVSRIDVPIAGLAAYRFEFKKDLGPVKKHCSESAPGAFHIFTSAN